MLEVMMLEMMMLKAGDVDDYSDDSTIMTVRMVIKVCIHNLVTINYLELVVNIFNTLVIKYCFILF